MSFDSDLGSLRFVPAINLTGLAESLLMCGQIMTVILASMVVRHSGPETDFVNGLRRLGCPASSPARSTTRSRSWVGMHEGAADRRSGEVGERETSGAGKAGVMAEGRGAIRGLWSRAAGIVRGDLGWIAVPVLSAIERASQREKEVVLQGNHDDRKFAHDVAVISGVGLVMMSLRMLKVLPGIPFASGYKNVVLVPLYILAADLTHSRFGATTAGTVMGLVGFLQGEGRYGVLDILRHVVPGLVIDGLWTAGSSPAPPSLDLLPPGGRRGGMSGFYRVHPGFRPRSPLGGVPVPGGAGDLKPGSRCPERRDHLWSAISLWSSTAIRYRNLPGTGSPRR